MASWGRPCDPLSLGAWDAEGREGVRDDIRPDESHAAAPPRGAVDALLPLDARGLLLSAGLAAVYWLTATVTLVAFVAPTVGPVAWPPAGVALAGLLLGGVRLWPGVFLGHLSAAAALGVAPRGPALRTPFRPGGRRARRKF